MTPHIFDIPLRACVSSTVPNLLFAGRNISATHIAFASTRVMATCAAIGQGVGTAAAYAVEQNIGTERLAADAAAMHEIQQRLLRADAYLIGRVNEDSTDIARDAAVSASSQQPEGAAVNVVSGQTRAVHGEWGARPDRANPGTHRWMSEPAASLPAWLEFRWAEPQRPGEIQLIFDSGLHRPLTLTHSDAYVERMVWGAPQTETVRDYMIEGRCGGEWQQLIEVTGNYQRRRTHSIDLEPECALDAVRVTVTATNGLDHARVCEVRVYVEDDAFSNVSNSAS